MKPCEYYASILRGSGLHWARITSPPSFPELQGSSQVFRDKSRFSDGTLHIYDLSYLLSDIDGSAQLPSGSI